ncbi:hypothetical protein CwatDRAFT_4263 [Crocosphaera watsonii WH 8501]|uniref:Uncharacterized protein n=2 Tax=Crocosphaera watsonii TaxID=263511 RepID=Q4C4R6_CROWT|nr:hypothetical protein CwatDRAFT_4263 [Crocosphaera watsonii WH 8501]
MTPKPMQDYNYQIGGTVENTLIYVSRKADTKIQKELKAGNFCYILNARQMGKSSLREQTTEKLKTKTMICASFALKQSYSTKTQWYGGFIQDLMKSLNSQLPQAINWRDWWLKNKDLEEIERLKTFIEEVLLANIQQNIVIFIDEIDTILSLQFSLDEFWTLIRECYEQRPNNPEYKRLTFAVFGVSTPYELIRDKNLTVDIGTAIDLTGFTFEEAKPLAKGLKKKSSRPRKSSSRDHKFDGGTPEFLTKSAIAKHRSLTGSGFEQSDRRFPQPIVCCQILS